MTFLKKSFLNQHSKTLMMTMLMVGSFLSPSKSEAQIASRNAFAAIEAESFSAQFGTQTSGGAVGYLDNADYLRYDGVNFGSGTTRFEATVAVPAEYAGQRIEIRVDSVTGPLLGTLTIQSTGGWSSYQRQSVAIQSTSGVKNLFLVMRGTAGIANIDRFIFTAQTQSTNRSALSEIEAESFNAQQGTQTAGGAVGYLDNADYLRYDNIDFGAGANRFEAAVAVPADYSGQRIEVRTDSVSGPLLGTLTVQSTGSWSTFQRQSVAIQSTSGVKNLFLVMRGTAGIANLDRFIFTAQTQSSEPVATSDIEAESFSAQQGTQTAGGAVGHLDDGDYLRYDNVAFGSGLNRFEAAVAVPAESAGQKIEVRVDSLTGPIVGELVIQSTGSWSQFQRQIAAIQNVSGVKTVFLIMRGTYGIGNLDKFRFAYSTTPVAPAPTPTPTPTPSPIVGSAGLPTPDSSGRPSQYLSYESLPASGAVTISGQSGTRITGRRISNPNGPCITITNSTNIEISGNKIGPCRIGILIQSGSSITIERNWIHDTVTYNSEFKGNFDGPGVRAEPSASNLTVRYNYFHHTTSGFFGYQTRGVVFHKNYVKEVHGNNDRSVIDRIGGQMFQVDSGASPMRITCNVSDQTTGRVYNEDHVNLYHSRGTSSDPILVAYNKIRGYGPSESNGGLLAGDGDGRHIRIHKNNVINPGGYGVAIAGGSYNVVSENKIFMNRSSIEKGMYMTAFSEYMGAGNCFNNIISYNRVNMAAGGFPLATWGYNCGNPTHQFNYSDYFGAGYNDRSIQSTVNETSLWNETFSECAD